jgi:indole-3-acetate monooxygenase
VPLGLARRAIDTVQSLAAEKRVVPEFVLLKDLPRVRSALARAEMMLGAARAYTYETLDAVWASLLAGNPLSRGQRVALGLSRIHATRTARDVALLMVDTAGTSGIYASSPLDRLIRDSVTLMQHVLAQDRMLEMLGGLVVGEESPLPFL